MTRRPIGAARPWGSADRMTVTTPDAGPIGSAFFRRAGKVLPIALLVVLVLFVIGYAVLPIRSWLDQRSEITGQQVELAEVEAANAALADRVEALGTLTEIERIARRDLGLVMPGEEAYAVLPPAPEPIRLPEAWPFTGLATALGS